MNNAEVFFLSSCKWKEESLTLLKLIKLLRWDFSAVGLFQQLKII